MGIFRKTRDKLGFVRSAKAEPISQAPTPSQDIPTASADPARIAQAKLDMALEEAVRDGDLAKVKECISLGADLSTSSVAFDGASLISVALSFKNFDVAKYLIDRGCDVNKADSFGETPLMKAIYTKRTDIVRLLLEKGADVSFRNRGGASAMDWARDSRNDEIIRILESRISKATSPLAVCPACSGPIERSAGSPVSPYVDTYTCKCCGWRKLACGDRDCGGYLMRFPTGSPGTFSYKCNACSWSGKGIYFD